ncbi:2-octaprenyl-6-methoxyphenyl hydroxylase [Ketobacter alkanivorans]|uniref:2-octaprenyl-6-methoxyphenyl hydroxylase n=1 Tax=Ketobacter alkanivorans TaxID=1917421 RepID=A0A2K9LMA6_9GAMM|nr:2-octaprenyl-6-methoxyphenyl hydroxylase [Ketobacter alkanivorans]AUM13370.1 2-octaprenyl-6-methoxyphenyl hydroxylase [Ketobacter alkanivorans]
MDIIIMGGGLVGASLAACLARDPKINIAVVEKFAPQPQDPHGQGDAESQVLHPSYDARNTALANGTCHVFDQLGLWQSMREYAVPIHTIDITNQGRFGRAVIRAEEERVRALGYVIENRYMGKFLSEHLQSCPNVQYLAPAEIGGLHYEGDQIVASVEVDGRWEMFKSPLVVIADGAQSQGRELLGIGAQVTSYDQVAIVTAVTPDRPHNNLALERFTDTGPLAVLPQTDNRWGLTWCLDQARADELMAADDATFMRALEQAAGSAIGNLTKVGRRFTYPLALTLAKEQVRPNAVVLGNAAHGLHPVAGQGLNMAMRDVAVLVQTLSEARTRGQSWGDFTLLNRYLQQREQDQFNTIQFSDKLTKLFSNRNPLLSMARNSGLLLFDTLGGTKRFVARHAMGRSVSTTLPEVAS